MPSISGTRQGDRVVSRRILVITVLAIRGSDHDSSSLVFMHFNYLVFDMKSHTEYK